MGDLVIKMEINIKRSKYKSKMMITKKKRR